MKLVVLGLAVTLILFFLLAWAARPALAIPQHAPHTQIDLEVVSIAAAAQPVCAGANVEFTALIRNNGSEESGQFDIRWDADDQIFNGGHFSIPAGVTDTHGHVWTNLPQGEHNLTFTVDDTQRITESNEANNLYLLDFTADECPVELPTVQFSASGYLANENNGTAAIEVTLSASSTEVVTVTYEASDGTAIGGADYTAISGTLSFAPGEISKGFSVPILPDGLDEETETVNLALSNPQQATLGAPDNVVLAILDGDPPPTVQFDAAGYDVVETGGAAITVVLNTPSGKPVRVHYGSSDGTAAAWADYAPAGGVLIFNPGEASKQFTVATLDDSLDEADETVVLTLANPENATLGALSTATLSLQDDDVAPVVSFGQASASVAESGGATAVAVLLSVPSGQPATVQVAAGDGTATAGNDYTDASGEVTFNPGETEQIVTVPILDDAVDEPDETIDLLLSNPTHATLGALRHATVTIIDDDEAPIAGFSAFPRSGEAPLTVQFSDESLARYGL